MKKVVVNSSEGEIRAAVLENGALADIFIERTLHPRYAGNIYKGKVENVLPGMQAAFVDVGLERNVFLYVDDILGAKGQNKKKGKEENGDIDEIPLPQKSSKTIKDMLKAGQEIVVQVTKDPIGTKGARVVTDITLPGRYVVLMPTVDYVGISRRIDDDEERERLKKIAQSKKPKKMGIIVRTVAEGRPEEEIASDIEFLTKLWKKIKAKIKRVKAPSLIHQDYDLMYRIARDYITEDVEEVVVDDTELYKKVVEVTSMISEEIKSKIHIYKGKQQIFEYYGIEDDINKALKRKVWLPSGGYLVIDHTEALTVIDVNTGKFIGSTCLEDTVLQTNLEAAKEIARQVRVRNIGGIIIIDFIDMDEESHRKQVLKQLEESMQPDKTKATVLGFTQLGLVEMTRKKVQQGLSETMTKVCSCCEGRGRIISEETLAYKAIREIKKQASNVDEPAMLIHLNPTVASVLIGFGGSNLANVEESSGKLLYVKGNAALKQDDVLIYAVGSKEEIERQALPVKTGDKISVLVEEHHMTNSKNGVARVEGYIIDIENAGKYVGINVEIEITKVFKTYAKAKVLKAGSNPLSDYKIRNKVSEKDNSQEADKGKVQKGDNKKSKPDKQNVHANVTAQKADAEPEIKVVPNEGEVKPTSNESKEVKTQRKRHRNRNRSRKNRETTAKQEEIKEAKPSTVVPAETNKELEPKKNNRRRPRRKPSTPNVPVAKEVVEAKKITTDNDKPVGSENKPAPKRRRRNKPKATVTKDKEDVVLKTE